MLTNRPNQIPDDAVNIIEMFVMTEPAPGPRCTMQEGSSFHWKTRRSKSCLPELLWRSTSRGSLPGWPHLGEETLLPDPVLPSPADWVDEDRRNVWVPFGRRCHKHQNPAISWSLVVAESAAGARRLHFSALQASASVKENVPSDSEVSRLLKHYTAY